MVHGEEGGISRSVCLFVSSFGLAIAGVVCGGRGGCFLFVCLFVLRCSFFLRHICLSASMIVNCFIVLLFVCHLCSFSYKYFFNQSFEQI